MNFIPAETMNISSPRPGQGSAFHIFSSLTQRRGGGSTQKAESKPGSRAGREGRALLTRFKKTCLRRRDCAAAPSIHGETAKAGRG
jgi:hypothetical protein